MPAPSIKRAKRQHQGSSGMTAANSKERPGLEKSELAQTVFKATQLAETPNSRTL